jgi:hypothetical protein
MLSKNLAVELAPSYGREPSRTLLLQAADATAVVKRANKRLSDMSFDAGALIQGRGSGSYNIRTN